MVTALEQLTDRERRGAIDDLNDLIRLDFDAIGAYETTIERLENQEWAETVGVFKNDHERHVRDLTALVTRIGGKPAERPHATGPLKQALVAVGAAAGDKGVLAGFQANELQAKTKYDKYAQKQDYPAEIAEVIRRNAEDEHRHYAWVVGVVGGGGA